MSGRITSIVGTTVDNQINLFVGTAGGGIWKSLNGGISFAPVFDKYCQSIGALAIDPTSPKTIYAAQVRAICVILYPSVMECTRLRMLDPIGKKLD
jgi:hypothetical protein